MHTNIIRNSAREAVINIYNEGTDFSYLITGGQVQAVSGGGETEQSLVTGFRTEIQGSTTIKHYSDKIPNRIKTAIFGNEGTSSIQLLAISGGPGSEGAVEQLALYSGTGRIDYDPPLETMYDCINPDFAISGGIASKEQSLYLILVPPNELS